MKIIKIFDILEDKIRASLSRRPIFYALLGILGIVLTWRGIWHLTDEIGVPAWLSAALGIFILLSTGLLVAVAIGDKVIISAFRGREKVTEIKLEETLTMAEKVDEIKNLLEKIEKRLREIKKEEEKIEKEVDGKN